MKYYIKDTTDAAAITRRAYISKAGSNCTKENAITFDTRQEAQAHAAAVFGAFDCWGEIVGKES